MSAREAPLVTAAQVPKPKRCFSPAIYRSVNLVNLGANASPLAAVRVHLVIG